MFSKIVTSYTQLVVGHLQRHAGIVNSHTQLVIDHVGVEIEINDFTEEGAGRTDIRQCRGGGGGGGGLLPLCSFSCPCGIKKCERAYEGGCEGRCIRRYCTEFVLEGI